jgi:hypothetical protein
VLQLSQFLLEGKFPEHLAFVKRVHLWQVMAMACSAGKTAAEAVSVVPPPYHRWCHVHQCLLELLLLLLLVIAATAAPAAANAPAAVAAGDDDYLADQH